MGVGKEKVKYKLKIPPIPKCDTVGLYMHRINSLSKLQFFSY